uniref:Secreted protein n=1 Tax=Anopheles darlingi TaxID=43151 RepID=A0A2M4D2Q4_ANODA
MRLMLLLLLLLLFRLPTVGRFLFPCLFASTVVATCGCSILFHFGFGLFGLCFIFGSCSSRRCSSITALFDEIKLVFDIGRNRSIQGAFPSVTNALVVLFGII